MIDIVKNKSLKKYNTFNIEAQAALFTSIQSDLHFKELVHHPTYKNNAKLIIGGGSNVLFTKNFEGLVIHNQIKGIHKIHESNEYVWRNLAGIENLSLIPGYMGAAPMQNIGAYGVELKDVFEELKAIDMQTGETVRKLRVNI